MNGSRISIGIAPATLATIFTTCWAAGAPEGKQADMAATTQPGAQAHTNRLIHATSPYLLQHAHNPVDWYEWGPEALEAARRTDRPIFLSIGYSACHWCHVMAHECFEDAEIAALMNEYFVCIKVDREERPDLDEIYMRATVLYTRGHGGWPMSVFLTPDLKPFFAGTYFPPDDRYGRPGFKRLCRMLHEAWRDQRDDLVSAGDQLADALTRSMATEAAGDTPTLAQVDQAADALAGAFDPEHGGLLSGTTNKFPPSMALELLLRSAWRRQDDKSSHDKLVGHVVNTLDHMANGGIRDHLGGGFARYSTDPRWHVPHFEKMLYDQALVSRIYIDAYLYTGQQRHADVAREVFNYVIADLQSPDGGFYSARDADSEDEEGRYYVWTKAEVVDALGAGDAELFCDYYNVSDAGNWQDPHAPGEAKNVLHVTRPLQTVAESRGLSRAEAELRLKAARRKLLARRAQRVAPALDTKVLCEWNGLMIASLARGGVALGEPRYIQAAARTADFVLTHQYADGRLRRAYRDGKTVDTAFITDYACMIEALIDLYEATFDKRWLTTAVALNDTAIERFWDEEQGGFFFTADDHEQLLTRSKEVNDGATPSGNSVQLINLLRLSAMLGDSGLRARAERMVALFGPRLAGNLGAGECFMSGIDFALAGALEIVVIGDPQDAQTRALLEVVRKQYVPNNVVLLRNPATADAAISSPLFESREMVAGKPAAYVCRNNVCQKPVTSPAELARQLVP